MIWIWGWLGVYLYFSSTLCDTTRSFFFPRIVSHALFKKWNPIDGSFVSGIILSAWRHWIRVALLFTSARLRDWSVAIECLSWLVPNATRDPTLQETLMSFPHRTTSDKLLPKYNCTTYNMSRDPSKCWSGEAVADGRGCRPRGKLLTDGCFSICWILAAVTDVFLPSESLMVCLPLLHAHDSNTIYTSPIWHRIKSFFIPLQFVGLLVNNQQSSSHGRLLSSTGFLNAEESCDWESRWWDPHAYHVLHPLINTAALLRVERVNISGRICRIYFCHFCFSQSASFIVDCWRLKSKSSSLAF